MEARYVKFDVEVLKLITVKAVGADRCTEIRKTHEGMGVMPSTL